MHAIEYNTGRVRGVLYGVFFFSGASALMYEMVWMRELRLVFGSTTVAVTASVALFLLGLGIGGVVLGYVADRVRYPVFLYGITELFVGFLGWCSSYYFSLIINSNASYALGMVLAGMYVLIAALGMGGTLPILVRGIVGTHEPLLRVAGGLYSVNTFGSVVGIICASFFLIEWIGFATTTFVAASVNIIIGLIAICFVRTRSSQVAVHHKRAPLDVRRYVPVLFLAALSGFIALSYEILWFRLYQPLIGPATYAFSVILIAFLWGLATGSALGSRLAAQNARVRLGYVFFGIAISAIMIVLASSIFSFPGIYLLFILPLHALLIGIAFPFFFALKAVPRNDVGSFTGWVYLVNTIGSVLGSACAGLVFLDLIGTVRSIVLISALCIFLATAIFWRYGERRLFWRVLGGSVTLLFVCAAMGSRISPSWITRFQKEYGAPVYQKEDKEAYVAAFKNNESGLLVMNGVGITHLTSDTKLLAHIPLMLHPDPKDVLVVALGIGTTYRSALTHDVNVTAVDIVPSLPPVLSVFFEDGVDLLEHPRGIIVIDDARSFIRRTRERYDVIVVDPPPPAWTTAANLFYSSDFYEEVQRVLRPGGMLVSWFYGGIDNDDLRMLERTFFASFPFAERWRAPSGSGEYLIGSLDKIPDRYAAIEKGMSNSTVADDVNEWLGKPLGAADVEGLYAESKQERLRRIGEKGIMLTDDLPRVEFFALRKWILPKPGT